MKNLILTLLASFALFVSVSDSQAADAAPAKKGRGKLTHMVAFKFKDTASKADIRKVEEAFAALPSKIPQIVSYEAGTNVSPEKLDKGFTHAFLVTFRTSQDRDEYLVHPEHKAFAGILGPYLADVFVIDFWTTKDGGPSKADKAQKSKKADKTGATQ